MDIVNIIKEYVKPELLILVPVLYLIGEAEKKAKLFKNKYIPVFLGTIGVLLSLLYIFATSEIKTSQDCLICIFTALTQGILLAGCSVYINQIYKQSNRME